LSSISTVRCQARMEMSSSHPICPTQSIASIQLVGTVGEFAPSNHRQRLTTNRRELLAPLNDYRSAPKPRTCSGWLTGHDGFNEAFSVILFNDVAVVGRSLAQSRPSRPPIASAQPATTPAHSSAQAPASRSQCHARRYPTPRRAPHVTRS